MTVETLRLSLADLQRFRQDICCAIAPFRRLSPGAGKELSHSFSRAPATIVDSLVTIQPIRSGNRRSSIRRPVPGVPTRRRRPALWHPPAACLRTPCSISSALWASPRHTLCPRRTPGSATLHPAPIPCPHDALPRAAYAAVATPSRIAPFPRAQPSPLRLAPRRTSLICTTHATALTRAALELVAADTLLLSAGFIPPSSRYTFSTQT